LASAAGINTIVALFETDILRSMTTVISPHKKIVSGQRLKDTGALRQQLNRPTLVHTAAQLGIAAHAIPET
jgi:hypothetical protein